MILKIFSKFYFLWFLLALPSIPMLMSIFQRNVEDLLPFSGEFSARLLILTLSITPLVKIFPKRKWTAWFVRHRRSFGVAAFAYAFLHTIFYLMTLHSLSVLFSDFFILGILTGWLAFFVFVPLAITSNNTSMKVLKKNWKKLQRLAYVAAVFTLLHWWSVHNEILEASLNFLPLVLLQIYRIKLYLTSKK
jgi:sulfoxide reductase heme-binding subunit YedZ